MEQDGRRTNLGCPPHDDAGLIVIETPIRPVAQARARGAFIGGHVRLYTPRRSRDFKDELASRIRKAIGPGFNRFDCPMYIEIDVTLEKPRSSRRALPAVKPDLDNFEKAVMDACTDAGLWRDDSLVVTKVSRKRYGTPSVRIAVRPESADE